MMKKLFKAGIVTILATFLLVACGNQAEKTAGGSDKIQAIATFSIIHDIVSEVGGEHVDVHSMVPIGTDPHEYEPLPVDIKKATDADALFYNGFNLEGEEHGWFFKLVDSVGADKNKVFELMEGVEPLYLTSDDLSLIHI